MHRIAFVTFVASLLALPACGRGPSYSEDPEAALGSAVALTEERATASFRQVEESTHRGNTKQEIQTGRYDLERDQFQLTIEEEGALDPRFDADNECVQPSEVSTTITGIGDSFYLTRDGPGTDHDMPWTLVEGSTHGSLRISFGPVLDYDRPAWPPVMDALREPEAVEETSPGRFVVTVPGEGLTPIVNRFGSYYGDGDADVPSAELIVYVEDGLIARVTFDQASLLAWVDELAAEQRAAAASGSSGTNGATGASSEPSDFTKVLDLTLSNFGDDVDIEAPNDYLRSD
jgi:hypothetical protein